MSSDPNEPLIRRDTPTELPPVEPPSARFIVQLFVIPAAIVLVLVVAYLAFVQLPFGRLANGGRDVMDYVRSIKGDNEHRRWRSAQDLANLINNDAQLAKDPRLLGELTNLFRDKLGHPDKKSPELAVYLALALGRFQITKANPVEGVALDPVEELARAVADGDQPPEVRVAAASSLANLAAQIRGKSDEGDVVKALALASAASDPEVRAQASYALGFYDVEAAHAALRTRVEEDEAQFVRYNAAVALTRLGDPAAARVLKEMLSPADLAQLVKRSTPSETQTAIEAVQLEALWALDAAPEEKRRGLARQVLSELENLSKVAPKNVRMEAQNVLQKIQKSASSVRGGAPNTGS